MEIVRTKCDFCQKEKECALLKNTHYILCASCAMAYNLGIETGKKLEDDLSFIRKRAEQEHHKEEPEDHYKGPYVC